MKSSYPRLRTYLLFILALLVMLFFFPSSISHSLRSGAGSLASPFLEAGNSIGEYFHTRITNIRNLGNLYDENAVLKQRIIDLEKQVSELANAAQENEHLRAELGITNRPAADETVAASIISRTTNNLLGEALIDQGENAGLKPGQAVVSQGIFIGRVDEVFKNTARISLVNSQNTIVQAKLTDSEALGLVSGGLTGLRLKEVDQGIEIREGEIVQTSGLGGTVPQGLIIGQVDHTVSEQNSPKQEAVIHSPINFDQLRLVFVILKTPSDNEL